MRLWPRRRGNGSNVEGLAYALSDLTYRGYALHEAVAALNCSHDDLRDRGVLAVLEQMRSEWESGPVQIRVPLVVTD